MEERGGLLVQCFCKWCVRYFYYYLQAVKYWNDYPESYPIPVYDQNGVQIGIAANKAEYISIWNANATNQSLGRLEGWYGPFGFKLITKKQLIVALSGLIIDNVEMIYIWSDGQGNFIQDGNNNFITTKNN